jgi:ribosomal protein S18 acetylase RimI-like enzyme
MLIRSAIPQDKKELIKLIKEFNSSDKYLSEEQRKFRAIKNLNEMAKGTAEKYLSPGYIIFVADKDGTLIGYVVGEIKDRKYKIYNKEGYIENWFVEKVYQYQGIGKKLFNKLIEEFIKVGCTHIGVDTNLENKKAIEIYEHIGFTKRLVVFFKTLKDLS